MAGVRTFNMCMNTNYLNDVGIKGLSINVNDGKSQRIICSCGHVGTEDTCPDCGNTNFQFVAANRWDKTSRPIYVKEKSREIKRFGNTFSVVRTSLMVHEVGKQLECCWAEETMAEITLNDYLCKSVNNLCITSNTTVPNFVLNNLDKIDDDAIVETLRYAEKISTMLYNSTDKLDMCYYLASWPCVCHILTDENLTRYKVFFKKTFNSSSWSNGKNPYPDALCLTMEDFWKLLKLPVEYANYYASTKFEYSYAYWRGTTNVDIKALHSLTTSLQKTMKSCLEHNTIGLGTISEIVAWGVSKDEKLQEICASYMKKFGMQYGNRVFDYFKESLEMAKNAGYSEDVILQPRKLAMLEMSELLRKRGFPDSRISAFCDVFDGNPEFGVDLLGSKAQLKKAEAEKIYR